MARDTASARPTTGDIARFVSVGVLVLYAAVVVLALVFRLPLISGDSATRAVTWFTALLAAGMSFAAWRELPREVNAPWLAFGGAALLAPFQPIGAVVLFTAGLFLSIQETERGRWTELVMDFALAAVAAAVIMLRWAPGIHAVNADIDTVLALTVAPVAAFCSALFMVVLLATPPATLPSKSAHALGAATLCLTITALPLVLRGEPCCAPDSPFILAIPGLWVFVMLAAATAIRARGSGVVVPQGERLRQFVAPTVAIVLAAISVDTSLHPPVERRTGVALGVLAVLVALRLTQLLQATRSQVAERRELAHTRALIEVSRALAGTNDLDVTLRTVTEWAQRVVSAKAAAIELLSPERKELVLKATTGLPQSIVGWTYPLDGSFTGWVVQTGEVRVTANAAHDPLISDQTLAIVGKAPLAAVPLRYRERILGVLTCIGTRPFDSTDLELLRAFANQAATALEDARLFEQVRTLSMTDPLTGLANRRHLDVELQREFAAARRGRRLVAVMFDLDEFKEHNDRYGHLAGDRALKHFAEALAGSTRAMNVAARFGGDEFFAVLADADRKGAELFVERIRARFQQIMQASENPVINVSAGIAEFQPDMETAAELIEAADRALYMAKSDAATSR